MSEPRTIPARTVPARRIPVPQTQEERDQLLNTLQPGDYCGPITGYTADKPAVFYKLPVEFPEDIERSDLWGFAHVVSPPHVFTEQPDGSLEIRESIGHHHYELKWHGYLDAGNIWREVEPTQIG